MSDARALLEQAREAIGEAHDISLDGGHTKARALLLAVIAAIDAYLSTPAPQADLAQQLADMQARKDGAYEERNKVVAALAKLFPSGIARTAIPGWSEDWHGCVYIDLPTGQVSWHFHDSQAHLFVSLPPYTKPWDGHDTPEKYRRLAALSTPAPAAPTCTRSHPHENMDAECERLTVVARANARSAPAAPGHSWHDAGQIGSRNVSWCSRCDTIAFTGHEPDSACGAASCAAAPAAPKPLTLPEIAKLLVEVGADPDQPGEWHLEFVRRIEAAHGITSAAPATKGEVRNG